MNLDHNFVKVWKFSEDQKIMQTEHFFPNFRSDVHPLKLLGGYSQIIGGYISPHPLLVSAPLAGIKHLSLISSIACLLWLSLSSKQFLPKAQLKLHQVVSAVQTIQ